MTRTASIFIGCGHLIQNIDNFRSSLAEAGILTTLPKLVAQHFNSNEMSSLLPGHDIAILGDDHVTANVMKRATPDLKAIIKWGIGTDNIDLEAAQTFGIPVYNTPGQFSSEVADLAIGMMLTLARQINIIDRHVRDGQWLRIEGESIEGAKAHIMGRGNIGKAIAKRLSAFDVILSGSDPAPKQLQDSFPCVSLNSGIVDADWIFVACPLNERNSHILDDSLMSKMKTGASIINVSRGGLIDETALCKHLSNGRLRGAALDVFEIEPFTRKNPLRKFPNVILGSHGGSSTRQAIQRVNHLTVKMAIDLLTNSPNCKYFNRVA